MSLFLPFNYNPSSTTVRSSSYTIPAGKYAFVSDGFGNLTINGATINSQPSTFSDNGIDSGTDVLIIGSTSTDRILDITINTYGISGTIVIHELDSEGNKLEVLTDTLGGLGTTIKGYSLPSGSSLIYTISGTPSASYVVRSYPRFKPEVHPIQVPAGTALNGSKYTVVEFDIA